MSESYHFSRKEIPKEISLIDNPSEYATSFHKDFIDFMNPHFKLQELKYATKIIVRPYPTSGSLHTDNNGNLIVIIKDPKPSKIILVLSTP